MIQLLLKLYSIHYATGQRKREGEEERERERERERKRERVCVCVRERERERKRERERERERERVGDGGRVISDLGAILYRSGRSSRSRRTSLL